MRTLVIVGCGEMKASVACEARDLYLSTLFRLARAYAEVAGDDWLIMSAKHGLVAPDKVLEPYDFTIVGKGKHERMALRHCVQADFAGYVMSHADIASGRKVEGLRVVALVGKVYAEILKLTGMRDILEFPLDGLQIGERQAWLKSQKLLLQSAPSIAVA